MSELELKPSISWSKISNDNTFKFSEPSFQKSEVIPNKVDKDGHHYLKVLLLSNKKTKNNWIAPYKNIGELPKEVLDSFLNVPTIPKHDHEFYDQLDETMKKDGLGTEERYQ